VPLFIGRSDQTTQVEKEVRESQALVPLIRLPDAAEARATSPALREDYAACAGWEPNASEIGVDALQQGFLRTMGGEVVVNADAQALKRIAGVWQVQTSATSFEAPIVVNASGAWADPVGWMAGCVPKRRTAFLFTPAVEWA